MGTPEFAIPSLEALVTGQTPILQVITQPDRPQGRGRKVAASPVKVLAASRGLPIYQPERIRNRETIERIAAVAPACIVVVAYGQLLPAELLEIPPLGAINVHASLLPKYRGPAPMHWSLIQGEEKTGVTTMLLDDGMDTGDILLQREIAINRAETAGSLYDRLAKEGAELLVETLQRLGRGTLEPKTQDHSQATYAPLLTREDGRVDWHESAWSICCRIHGMDPWPGAFTLWQGKRLKLFGCRPLSLESQVKPGTLVAAGTEGLRVAAGKGSVLVETLQLEGRRPLAVADFLRGHPLQVETVFGE
jgi:methionyl-tRNA formyltransferase